MTQDQFDKFAPLWAKMEERRSLIPHLVPRWFAMEEVRFFVDLFNSKEDRRAWRIPGGSRLGTAPQSSFYPHEIKNFPKEGQ